MDLSKLANGKDSLQRKSTLYAQMHRLIALEPSALHILDYASLN